MIMEVLTQQEAKFNSVDNETIEGCVKSIAHAMCLLHRRSWTFKDISEAMDWLVDLTIMDMPDRRRAPGPTKTLRLISCHLVPYSTECASIVVPRIIARILNGRPDVVSYISSGNATPLVTYGRLFTWFFTTGMFEMGCADYARDLIGFWVPSEGEGLPPIALALWIIRGDLQEAFDLESPADRAGLQNWFWSCAFNEYPALGNAIKMMGISDRLQGSTS